MKKITLALAASVALALLAAPAEAGGCYKKKRYCSAPTVVHKTVHVPARPAVAAYPGPGPAPMVFEYGDPYAMQAARDGCPLVHDVAGPLQRYPDGQLRYRWRGSDWAFLPGKPAPDSRICTRNGHLAWWTPPRPQQLPQQQAPAPEQSAPPPNK